MASSRSSPARGTKGSALTARGEVLVTPAPGGQLLVRLKHWVEGHPLPLVMLASADRKAQARVRTFEGPARRGAPQVSFGPLGPGRYVLAIEPVSEGRAKSVPWEKERGSLRSS